MHKTKDQLYETIKDLKTKKEFKEEIKKRELQYNKLIDEDTIALMIVDELGRNKENKLKINQLEQGTECTVFGKITKIYEMRNFSRKNGSIGRVINLELTDESGTCGLALWDKDVELIKSKKIQKGTCVEIINGYIKEGFNGLEINVGRCSLIEIKSENILNIKNDSETNKIEGKVIEIDTTRPFFKDNGEFGFVTNIKLETKDNVKQITIWDKKVKEIQKFKQGDQIQLENVDVRMKNGKEELHINSKGSIKKL